MSTLLDKAKLVAIDLQMLRDGTWVPDKHSAQSTLGNAVDVAHAIPQLMSILMLAASGNTEYDDLQAKAADILAKLEQMT